MKCVSNILITAVFLFVVLPLPVAYAQVSPYVVEVKIPTASEQSPLTLSVQLTQNTQIQQMLLHYRQFGETEYKQMEMTLSGRVAVATLPAKAVMPPYIEYYIEIHLAGVGTPAFFPSENPELNPLKIDVKGVDPRDTEIRFLSPEPGQTLAAEDLVVAISLMYTSDKVDRSKTRLYFDGIDVTSEALLSDDVLLYNPKNFDRPLTLGAHSIKVELRDTSDQPYYTKELAFTLSTGAAIEEAQSSFQYGGNGQLELRNEKIDTTSTAYQRADAYASGTYKSLMFGGSLHITNEDKPDRQPQNRYLGTLQVADYLKLQVGDAYGVFPSLMVSGKRVRGITGSVRFDFFNLDVTYGKTDRAVEGTVIRDTTYADSSLADARPTASLHLDSLRYRLYNSGTYARNFFAVRPSFGSGENFQFGLTYVKAKDDIGSITYGVYPRENVVGGADLLLAFDNQRIRWASQAAFSLENTDISSGSFSDADIDQYEGVNDTTKTPEQRRKAKSDADQLKSIAKIGRTFITVNGNLSPLNPVDGMPSVAYESELTLNYFNNYVRAFYFRRGIAYTSYGNDFVQTDIAGINVSDRIRLFDNRMMAGVSYETKSNNTQHDASKPTTTYNALSTSLTVFPGGEYPSLTVGYGLNTRKNPVDAAVDTTYIDSVSVANEATNRFFIATNYEFQMLVRHSLTASVSIASKNDNTFFKRNQNNLNLSVSVTTTYTFPLQTTIALIISQNKAYQAKRDTTSGRYLTQTDVIPFSYSTVSLNARYRMFSDRLNLLATFAPSFGDFKRLLIQAGAEYQLFRNNIIVGQLDFMNNSSISNDVIASIIYRLSF
jgi:hypothetical protein